MTVTAIYELTEDGSLSKHSELLLECISQVTVGGNDVPSVESLFDSFTLLSSEEAGPVVFKVAASAAAFLVWAAGTAEDSSEVLMRILMTSQ